MAQGKKSEAAKRREKLVSAGLLDPTVDQVKRANGLIGLLAQHGPEFSAKLLTPQDVKRSIPQAVRSQAELDAVACAKFLADLALGRDGYEKAPLRERRAAAVDVIQLAGVRLAPAEETPDGKPLGEMSLAELHEFIETSKRELAERLESETRLVNTEPES